MVVLEWMREGWEACDDWCLAVVASVDGDIDILYFTVAIPEVKTLSLTVWLGLAMANS
jgi:hypothetical protein